MPRILRDGSRIASQTEDGAVRTREGGSRLLVPGCGIALLALFSLLYVTDTALYLRILVWMMGKPFPHPFIDWEWIPSAVECWRRSVDVYVDNTCYEPIAHGRHGYSPLWLRMTFLPYGKMWVTLFGLAFALLFFAALATLPPPRGANAVLPTILATFSPLTAFALERGNVDLIMFVMAIVGVNCWLGTLRFRLAGYAIFLLAGLLKFYPFVLLVLAMRERSRILTGICTTTLAVLLTFSLVFHRELLRMVGNIPTGSYFVNVFAAVNLPSGLVAIGVQGARDLGGPDVWTLRHQTMLRVVGLLLLTLVAFLGATRLVTRHHLDSALVAMPRREAGFLVTGAILICACFFAGQNVDYRAIMILPTLPGLLWLGRSLPEQAARALFMVTCWAIVLVMWVPSFRQFITVFAAGDLIFLGHWLIRELVWWWLVTVLAAVLAGFVLSRASQTARRCLRSVRLGTADRHILGP